MRFFFIIIVGLFLTACRSANKVQTAIPVKDTVVTVDKGHADSVQMLQTILAAMDSNKIDFTTFSAKIGIEYRDAQDKKYDLNANLRMYQDSAIWISVNAILGIEAMRALITKDSIWVMDKQNKIVTARSIDYLQEITALPLSLSTLQNLIIGNAVFADGNVVSYAKGVNTISILSLGKWFKNLTTLNEEDKTIIKSKLDDTNVARNRTADLSYSDYKKEHGINFATKRKITVVDKKKLDIGLDFKQYNLNDPVEFPFSIPRNYKKG